MNICYQPIELTTCACSIRILISYSLIKILFRAARLSPGVGGRTGDRLCMFSVFDRTEIPSVPVDRKTTFCDKISLILVILGPAGLCKITILQEETSRVGLMLMKLFTDDQEAYIKRLLERQRNKREQQTIDNTLSERRLR